MSRSLNHPLRKPEVPFDKLIWAGRSPLSRHSSIKRFDDPTSTVLQATIDNRIIRQGRAAHQEPSDKLR